jgi:hypothetical protein
MCVDVLGGTTLTDFVDTLGGRNNEIVRPFV